MGVEIVHQQGDALGIGIRAVDPIPQGIRPIDFRPMVSALDEPLSGSGFKNHKPVVDPVAYLLVVVTDRVSNLQRQRLDDFPHQLLAGFIHTDRRMAWIIRTLIDLQHILHRINKFRIRQGGETPPRFQPGFKLIFFSVCRTVSLDTVSTSASSTSFAANRLSVQRPRSSGGRLHTSATQCASGSRFNLRGYARLGAFRSRAADKPASTNRSPTRSRVEILRSSAALIA